MLNLTFNQRLKYLSVFLKYLKYFLKGLSLHFRVQNNWQKLNKYLSLNMKYSQERHKDLTSSLSPWKYEREKSEKMHDRNWESDQCDDLLNWKDHHKSEKKWSSKCSEITSPLTYYCIKTLSKIPRNSKLVLTSSQTV